MQLNPQTIYYSIAATSAGGAALWCLGKWVIVKPVQYFTRLEGMILSMSDDSRRMSADVNEIKTNHLPHMYERITRIEEQLEARQDQISHS